MTSHKSALYASVGNCLTRYDLDADKCTLEAGAAVTLPAKVQYAWPHANNRFLYVASSEGGPGAKGADHWVSSLRIDGGEPPQLHGAAVRLRARPIHITTDIPAAHLLLSYNDPSSLSVHRINADGSVGHEVAQPQLDTGIYAHQIRVAPSNAAAILVTRGNDALHGKPEDPGALKLFDYRDGHLTDKGSFAPGGGYGFGPRHIDFHPTQPWLYVSLERQNEVQLFRFEDNTLHPKPAASVNTLADRANHGHEQRAGTLHLHPHLSVLYVANRAHATVEHEGAQVFAGGENNIAVYELDEQSGEPTLVQHAQTHGLAPRTFAIDPSGRMLVAANHVPLHVRDGSRTRWVAASLAVFRIDADGTLEYVRKYDVDVGNSSMFWMGIV